MLEKIENFFKKFSTTRRRLAKNGKYNCKTYAKCVKEGNYFEDPTILVGGQFIVVQAASYNEMETDTVVVDRGVIELKVKIGLYSSRIAVRLDFGPAAAFLTTRFSKKNEKENISGAVWSMGWRVRKGESKKKTNGRFFFTNDVN